MEQFDPLAVENIGVTLAIELLEQPLYPLPPEERFSGAGVYALYYSGPHVAYSKLVEIDQSKGSWKYPIYIGKAVRENSKQGFSPRPTAECKIWDRLRNHAASIQEVEAGGRDPDFSLSNFRCRFLILNDAYTTLAESVLISTFRPAWNGMGFGSKVVGGERMTGRPSLWDSLHPGRGGRPPGTAERGAEAAAKIQASIDKLSEDHSDPRFAKMVEKIKHFL